LLRDHNLLENKHIPELYIINDAETRLQLLAGLIDTDGTLSESSGFENFEICKEINTHGHIIDKLEYIANSLGFRTSTSVSVRSDSTLKRLRIGGDIHRIPTRLPRKQSTRQTPFIGRGITVKHVGRGDYVGWYIDGNERFLFGDWTCGHNTRFEGGKDAAQTRYSFVRPERLVGYIIRKEDRPILKHVIDEGEIVEPETYYPIIPMILVNGGQGIGTGYSTFVPCHNPLDIITWLRMKLNGVEDKFLPDILPWYRDFKGVIKVIDRRRRKRRGNKVKITIINNVDKDGIISPQVHNIEAEDDSENNNNENLPGEDDDEPYEGRDLDGSRPLLSMVSMGKFHMDLNGTIIITELPIGRWPIKYRKWLEDLVEAKEITGYRDLSVDNRAYFEISGFKETPNYRNLKLQRTMGMSNMVLLDDDNRPVRYDTAYDILEAFYSRRLPFYAKRKEYIIQHLADEIQTLTHKITFIQAIINKQIRIINKRKATVYAAMDELGIPHQIYDKSMAHHLSEDDIAVFNQEIRNKEAERDFIIQTTPEQMWLRELAELEEAYRSVYNIPKPVTTLNITAPTNYSERGRTQAVKPDICLTSILKPSVPTGGIYLNL